MTFYYFEGHGRADPLRQMFEFHGQPYKKVKFRPEDWAAKKANGEGGEFGGGLPQAFYTENGKQYRLSQMGSILRHFGVRYGYYYPASEPCCMYADPIVDTFSDIMGALSKMLFPARGANKSALESAYISTARKYHQLVE